MMAVVLVSAINATQVEVKFNQPVDKNDAESGKVSIQGVTFAGNGVLSADGKTLTLTANAAIDVKNAAVVVEPISSKANALVKTEKYVGLMTYKDEVAPTIVSVEAKTNGTVATQATIKVSEPVKNGALIKVNGSYASVNFNNTDTAVVTGLNLETGKTHTVELINLEDLAGNKTVSTSASFTVSVDTVAPTATLSTQSDKNIVVTFNKSMNVSATEAALGNGVVKDEALADVTTGSATVVADSDNKQFLIPVTDALYTNKDSRTLNVVLKDTIVDALGNKLVPTTQSVTLTKDATKPVATGYDVVREADGKVKAIVVNFSEGLKASGASDSIQAGQTLHQAATSIVNENGVAETTKFANYKSKAVANGDKKVVFEATTAEKINGKYAISFKNELVKDLSETGNKSNAFNYTIDFGQDESVATFDVTSATASNNVITVTFPEAVKGGAVANSATDIANYTLAGKPLPAETTITLDADQEVATIKLPAESVAKDDQAAIFTVANVKNTAGTKTVKSYTGTVNVKDDIKPVLESAKALDNKTIELTYSEAIAALTANQDVSSAFDLEVDGTSLGLTANQLKANNVSGFANKIRLTIDKGTDSAGAKEVNTLTIANGASSGAGNITVTFDDGGANIVKTVAVAHNDTNAQVATKVAAAFSDLAGYDVTASTNNVVFTAKQAAADKTVTVTVVDTDTTGVGTPSATQTTAGAAPTSATKLDFTKTNTIKTKEAVIQDKAGTPNTQKSDVKVTIVKPN